MVIVKDTPKPYSDYYGPYVNSTASEAEIYYDFCPATSLHSLLEVGSMALSAAASKRAWRVLGFRVVLNPKPSKGV